MANKERTKYFVSNNKYGIAFSKRSHDFKEYIKLLVNSGIENICIITKNGTLSAKEWLANDK